MSEITPKKRLDQVNLERVHVRDKTYVLVGEALNSNERTVYADEPDKPLRVLGMLFHKGGRWDWYRDRMDGNWPARFLARHDAISDLLTNSR
jgi:hypothetical protein